MTLPERRFYSLNDAIEHLSRDGFACNMNDILHYASIAAFKPLIFIDGEWESSNRFIDDNFESELEIFTPTDTSNEQSDIHVLSSSIAHGGSSSSISEVESEPTNENERNYNDLAHYDTTLRVNGLWEFNPISSRISFFHELTNAGSVGFYNCLIDSGYATFLFDTKKITPSDIYMSSEDFHLLKDGGRKNQEDNITSTEHIKKNKREKLLTESRKTKADQFIRDLIYLLYSNEQYKNEPWRLIREDKTKGEPSDLEIDFDAKGLILPSRKTLKRWTD
ncbi:hypothetical protein ACLFLC_21095 [Providencia rettgeri]